MSYDIRFSWDDELDFYLCKVGGKIVGFPWDDEAIQTAIKNRDPRIFEILEHVVVHGMADLYDRAVIVEEEIYSYGGDLRDQYRRIDGLYKRGLLSAALRNPYVEDATKRIIEDYFSGDLYNRLPPRNPKRDRVARRGYVYLIRAENNLYKIGKAVSLANRLQPFSVSFPMEWQLVCAFRSLDYARAEKELHKRFDGKRKTGEWFALSQEDVDYILGIPSEIE